ncbi:MAG: hypothetical protein ACFB6R_13900 [Alphaproteobacteria bacterium]
MRVLVLTDHHAFSHYDSQFALTRALRRRWGLSVHVASRRDPNNADFFADPTGAEIWTRWADRHFLFETGADWFEGRTTPRPLTAFGAVIHKIEPPLDEAFLAKLASFEDRIVFINSPSGMIRTSTKLFLRHVADLVPGFAVCETVTDVVAHLALEPSIVIKPASGSSGRGLIRIGPDGVWDGSTRLDGGITSPSVRRLIAETLPGIAMRFLPDVVEGDKRILVFNGSILGGLLRLPKAGSWIANVAQGGRVRATGIDEEERAIVARIDPLMREHGVPIYGIDTLRAPDGFRVLSEINTANPNGMIQIETLGGQPVLAPLAAGMHRFIADRLMELRLASRRGGG